MLTIPTTKRSTGPKPPPARTNCSSEPFPERAQEARSGPMALTHFHFDLFRPGLFALGQMHSQHAVLKFRLHVVRFGVIRDAEAAFEPAVVTFHAMEPAALLFLLGFAFAGN